MKHSTLLGFLGSKNLSRCAGAIAGLLFLGASSVCQAKLLEVVWTMSDGVLGPTTVSGTFTTTGLAVNTSSINAGGYNLSGPVNGLTWTVTSDVPVYCVLGGGGCAIGTLLPPGTATFHINELPGNYHGTVGVSLEDTGIIYTGHVQLDGVPVYSNSPAPRAGLGLPALLALAGVAVWRRRDWFPQISRG